jgi:uroporphyrinogen-III synthase
MKGRRILLTRPAGQNERLAALVRAAGGEPLEVPAIEIRAPDDPGPLRAVADRLEDYDLAVFVSPNAVDQAMAAIRSRRAWPARLRAATVGTASAQALARHGVSDIIAPSERFDSEALLALPALGDARGRRVVIFRGDGGRELLGDTLRERGATVEYVECYRRLRPADATPLARAFAGGAIDAVVVTSSEGLRNLFELAGEAGRARLQRTPVFAPHARIAETARALDCAEVVATAPGDAGLAAALVAFWAKM